MDYDRFEMGERLIDQISQFRVGSKGNFTMTADFDPLPRIDVDTFTRAHFSQFKSAEIFNLHILVGCQGVDDYIEQDLHKLFRLLTREMLFLCEKIYDFRYGQSFVHSLSSFKLFL